jgi:hypothetical protein
MKLSYLLFASLATTAVASPQRLRNLEHHEGSMSVEAKASKEELAMSVASKATKLFKPSPSKAGKESMSEFEEVSMAKAGKALSME